MNRYTPALLLIVFGFIAVWVNPYSRPYVAIFVWLGITVMFLWVRYAIREGAPHELARLMAEHDEAERARGVEANLQEKFPEH